MAKQKTAGVVPRLRFPQFRNEAAWKKKSIAEVCERVTQGGTPDTSNASFWDGGIAWLTPAEMGKDEDPHIALTRRTLTREGLEQCSSALLPVGSIIVSTRAPIGHLAINRVPMAINQGCKGLVANSDVHYKFLYFSLLNVRSGLIDLGAGNTFKELASSALKNFEIPAPQQPEQQKIADCFNSLDDLIAAQDRKVEALKAHKRGLMQQLFPREGETVPHLRFPEFRGAGEWESALLGEIVRITKGKGISKADITAYGKTPCIRYGELYTVYGEIIDKAMSRTNVPVSDLVLSERGDVIVPASGETKEDIATCSCVVDSGIALGGDLNILRGQVDGRFLSYYLSGAKRKELGKIAQGDTVAHLYPRQLEKLAVQVPAEVAEQQRIADCLSTLDTQITAETEQLTALKTHKQGLMQQLFPAPEAQ